MSHQDHKDVRTNLQALKAVFDELLPRELNELARHGNAMFKPRLLAALAITCWGWTAGTLHDRFATAGAAISRVLSIDHTGTRQGIMKALASCGHELTEYVTDIFAAKIRSLGRNWSNSGKVNFAVDGTKFAAPRTSANQNAFAAARLTRENFAKGYKKSSDESKALTVQVLVTVLWHINTGLPFRWRTDGSTGSERKNLVDMLEDLPSNARIIGDAEYVGYPFWTSVIRSGRSFLVRVGSNVRLLKNLGKLKFVDGFVYYWPEAAIRRNQPPIVLRVIKVHNGRQPIYLLTNELDMEDHQASTLYTSRWGIEVFFRSVKQSCQRSKLCCHTPTNVDTEINWTLLGIWAAMFMGKQTQLKQVEHTTRVSPVKVIRAFASTVIAVATRAQDATLLTEALVQATIEPESNRTTSKNSRNYPRKKKHRCSGAPKIKHATRQQQILAVAHLT